MAKIPTPDNLARFSARRPWLVVSTWLVLVVASVVLASGLSGLLTTSYTNSVETESNRADTLLAQRLYGEVPASETVIVQSDKLTVDDPAFRSMVTSLAERLGEMRGSVAAVSTYYDTGNPSLVSQDRKTTLIGVLLAGDKKDAGSLAKPVIEETERLDGQDGFTVVTGGDGSVEVAFTETAESDLRKAELLGIPIALVVLIAVFGTLGAAWLPIGLSLVSIIVAIGVTAVLGRAFELQTFVLNMITMMGLAVGIDYSLLIIQRFREERRRGLSRDAAIESAGATAGRSVLFSGLAVVVALCGMLIVPNNLFRSLGAGAAIVVIVAVLAALTLLPAVIRLLGDRVDRLRLPLRGSAHGPASGQFWTRTTGAVIRHPVLSVVFSVGLLLSAALPYAGIRLGSTGVSSLPPDSGAHRALSILSEEFTAGVIAPTQIVVEAADTRDPAVQEAVQELLTSLANDRAFGAPTIGDAPSHDLTLITVPLAIDPGSESARAAISRLRRDYVPETLGGSPARAFVTGGTAADMDSTSVISDNTLPVFVFVLGMSFVVLLLVFRSIVVPLKAIVMNLLSVGAAYGLMVLVFQRGAGHELFGFQKSAQIEPWVPLFMFAVLFGLSMDYHVFLLSRIRERFGETHDNAEAVAYGIRTTAGMITGAALIMVAVFAGFASGDLIMFQQMGFGLAVAVLLDATIVRVVLVPASMELLGDRNWYLPSWLEWLPVINVEGGEVSRSSSSPIAASMLRTHDELGSGVR